MSLILDALRRAERGRARDLGQRIGQALPPRARRGTRWTMPLVTAAILSAAVVAGASLWPRLFPAAPLPGSDTTVEPVTPAPARAPAGSSLAEITVPEPVPALDPSDAVRAPLLHELPADVRAGIPGVSLDAHFWSPDPGRRFVMIGMDRYRVGDRVPAGLHIHAILPEGVEFDWRGTRFRILAR